MPKFIVTGYVKELNFEEDGKPVEKENCFCEIVCDELYHAVNLAYDLIKCNCCFSVEIEDKSDPFESYDL